MKRVVIHAGPGKTGTSAIQYWLNSHGDDLAQNGIFYPNHELRANKMSSGNLTAILSKNATDNWSVDGGKIAGLMQKFEQSPHRILLLSSEFFYKKIGAIAKHIEGAEFVVYLRNPIEFRESGYSQAIKCSAVTHPLILSPGINFQILDDLDTLLESGGALTVKVRPYAHDLFVGGNIISDFLSVVGYERAVPEPPLVNTSYRFAVLEFKRHANHFPLGRAVDRQLNIALQDCPVGIDGFSLIPPEVYGEIRRRLSVRLGEFIDKYEYRKLGPYLDWLKTAPQRRYLEQCATNEQLLSVSEYLNRDHPKLYKRLRRIVKRNSDFVLPNSCFFDCFEITKQPSTNGGADREERHALVETLRSPKVKSTADACRVLALYFEKRGDIAEAAKFMSSAYELDPNTDLNRIGLNRCRLEIRKQSGPFQSIYRKTKSQ